MASQGPNNPSTASNLAPGVAWTSPGNVFASDSVNASVVLLGTESSQRLRVTGFGFTIPAGATIVSFFKEAQEGAEVGSETDFYYKYMKAGAEVGNESPGRRMGTNITIYNTSDAAGLGGATWTVDDVNAAGFGVSIKIIAAYDNTPLIDHVRLTVNYTLPSFPRRMITTQAIKRASFH